MKKYAWTWKIKPECVEEYVRMHMNPWPEIMAKHSEAGFRNFSIFQNGNQFFYEFETDLENVNDAFAFLEKDPDCKRWTSITSKMVEGGFDYKQSEPIVFLPEVFYLK
jgi:L-rhamnose mutarotase